jgi:hypothetical protein
MYTPNAFSDIILEGSGFWYMKNFWDLKLNAGTTIRNNHDYFVLNTPGRFVQRPTFSYGQIQGSTDSRKRLYFSYNLLAGVFNVKNKDYYDLDMGVRYRFSNRLSMELSHSKEMETEYIIYDGKVSNEPRIAFVDFTDQQSILSGIYHFAPRMNLTVRARHYWSKVLYNSRASVDTEGNAINITAPLPDSDQNVNVFNVDAFFTWDFRLGSRLILGYKNWLGEDEMVDGKMQRTYLANFGKLFNLRHANEITARFIYYLDYNQLRKKH